MPLGATTWGPKGHVDSESCRFQEVGPDAPLLRYRLCKKNVHLTRTFVASRERLKWRSCRIPQFCALPGRSTAANSAVASPAVLSEELAPEVRHIPPSVRKAALLRPVRAPACMLRSASGGNEGVVMLACPLGPPPWGPKGHVDSESCRFQEVGKSSMPSANSAPPSCSGPCARQLAFGPECRAARLRGHGRSAVDTLVS